MLNGIAVFPSRESETIRLRQPDFMVLQSEIDRDFSEIGHAGHYFKQIGLTADVAHGEPQRTKAIARTLAYHGTSLGALSLELSVDDLAAIETAVPVGSAAGTRYDAMQMSFLDSEK